MEAGAGPLTVTEIAEKTGLSQSNVSNHLACLRDCGLAVAEQDGRYVTYHHFIDAQDFSKEELLDMIELVHIIKEADKQGATPKPLQDATLAMIFEEPSTRTRISKWP